MATMPPETTTQTIFYPETDGKPMGETEAHIREIIAAIVALQEFFRARDDVYVNGDMLLYYREGAPHLFLVPDVFVVFGVAKHERRVYKLWEEGEPPTVVIEFTSRSTHSEDQGNKRVLYASLGVREYFLFDR